MIFPVVHSHLQPKTATNCPIDCAQNRRLVLNYSLMPRGDQRLGATAMVILMPTLQSLVFQPLELVASGHEAAWRFQAGLCCDGGPKR